MPRFFFHVLDGVRDLDEVGTELADCEAARLEAIRIAGDVIKSEARRIALGEDWRIEVTDEGGLSLFHMAFMVIDAPAMRRRSMIASS